MKRFIALLSLLTLLAGCFAMPAAAAPADTAGYAAEVLRLVNAERQKAGLAALVSGSVALNAAAQKRAEELVARFDHRRPGGSSCFSVLDEYGVVSAASGENIAAGYASPEKVMAAWMKSPGHRANILGGYNRLGVGVYVKNGVVYWAQMFTLEGGASAARVARWRTWPGWAQTLLRVFCFGWIWMK